jgi:hypothetical protein
MRVYCVWAWDQYYPNGCNGNLKGMYTDKAAAEARVAFIENAGGYDFVDYTEEYVDNGEEDDL